MGKYGSISPSVINSNFIYYKPILSHHCDPVYRNSRLIIIPPSGKYVFLQKTLFFKNH